MEYEKSIISDYLIEGSYYQFSGIRDNIFNVLTNNHEVNPLTPIEISEYINLNWKINLSDSGLTIGLYSMVIDEKFLPLGKSDFYYEYEVLVDNTIDLHEVIACYIDDYIEHWDVNDVLTAYYYLTEKMTKG